MSQARACAASEWRVTPSAWGLCAHICVLGVLSAACITGLFGGVPAWTQPAARCRTRQLP